jgi:hypothetical protein
VSKASERDEKHAMRQARADALCDFYTRDELREVARARFGHFPSGYATKAELAFDMACMGITAPLDPGFRETTDEAERRDTERIRRELLDQLDAGGPELADAVARNLTINAAASLLDAIAEAVNEESR